MKPAFFRVPKSTVKRTVRKPKKSSRKLLPTPLWNCWPLSAIPMQDKQLSISANPLRIPLAGERRESCSGAYLIIFIPRT